MHVLTANSCMYPEMAPLLKISDFKKNKKPKESLIVKLTLTQE